ncbi:MAG: ParA family protein [Chthoniobacteraceae bacterium]|jgi:cellulose biosynthesis protein BcsQ
MKIKANHPANPVLTGKIEVLSRSLVQPKHPGAISVVNYKGGVGKTTVSCLLGYYLADHNPRRKVLLFDIDPQCSLSLALGFDPDEVNKTELTIFNLVKPSKWTSITKTNFDNYVFRPEDSVAPKNLFIVRGSFDVDELDMDIAQTLAGDGNKFVEHLYLYCKQMLYHFSDFDYVIIDCPPNKMFLTQAMLRASTYYLPVTIPDAISVYGMPRLLRWVKKIPPAERPLLLGYVLNALNRHGGGMVVSQQSAESELLRNIAGNLEPIEKQVLGADGCAGEIPRLDIIARFLASKKHKLERLDFSRKISGQPSVDECLEEITATVLKRIRDYRAKI